MKSLLCLLALAVPSLGAISVSLPGTSENATWTGLTSATYTSTYYPTGFNTSTNYWLAPVDANGGTASAKLNKVAGGGYFSSAGYIYTGSGVTPVAPPGDFRIYDDSPLASLQTIVLQGNMNQDILSISLNYNGGNQALPADWSLAAAATTYMDRAWQWDLSGVTGPITSYEILVSFAPHTAITSFGLNSSNSFAQVIPEPSSAVVGIAALGLTLIRRRRA